MGGEAEIALLRQHAEPIRYVPQGLRPQRFPNLSPAGRPAMLLTIGPNKATDSSLSLCSGVHQVIAVHLPLNNEATQPSFLC